MQEQDDIQKELKDLSPLLAALKKEEQQTIPANYFEELPDTVLRKVQTSTSPKTTTIGKTIETWLNHLFEPRIALAFASVVILLMATYWLAPTKDAPAVLLAEASTEEISIYISENIDDFEEVLLEILPEGIELSFDEFHDLDDSEVDELMDSILDDLDDNSLDDLL